MSSVRKRIFSKELKADGLTIRFAFFKIKLKKLLCLLEPVFRFFDFIVPKHGKTIAFFSYPDFSDNPKVFSDFVFENHPEYRIFWFYGNPMWNNDIKNVVRGKRYYRYSIRGIFHLMRCKYVVFSYAQSDFLSSRHVFINLWHGMPIKTLGFTEAKMNKAGMRHYSRLAPLSHSFVTSDFFRIVMSACFAQHVSRIHITGQPRTDAAFDLSNHHFDGYSKVVCYVPTFKEQLMWGKRDITTEFKNIFYLPDYDEKDFFAFLENNNWLLLFKPHPLDEAFYRNYFKANSVASKHFRVLYDYDLKKKKAYFYQLFSMIDVLISDFSSIALDYLITRSPVIYLNFLNKDYAQNRGFILEDNYEILMPGEKVDTYVGLKSAIVDALTIDSWKERRERILPLIHKYQDGQACQRVFEVMAALE